MAELPAGAVRAPFAPAQVASLNDYQRAPVFHPFTCAPASHLLVATPAGWVCSEPGCGYTQDWAWDWMANRRWELAAPRVIPRG